MKKYVGKKWSQISKEQQKKLLSNVAGAVDAVDSTEIKNGECILDFSDNLSVSAYIKDYEIVIDDDAILYDPNKGVIFENEKFKGLISLKDAAAMFNKEESTLRRNISNGFFKEWQDCVKFGNTWVFDINALEKKYKK